jgi:hypothetical protein
MPTVANIARWWAFSDMREVDLPELKAWWIGWGEPFCFSCGLLAPVPDTGDWSDWNAASGMLDRAHLIDHARGGSADPSNLVLLCHGCHAYMPSFGDRHAALVWVTAFSIKTMAGRVMP